MRTQLIRAFALVLVLGGLCLIAQPAAACTQICEKVSETSFCRVCTDTGQFTGATCQQSGACLCFYTQNNCFAGASDADDLDFLAQPALMTPATPPATGSEAEEADRTADGDVFTGSERIEV